MDMKDILGHLGRIKIYYKRNEIISALGFFVMALQGIIPINALPTDLKSRIREAVQLFGRDERVKKYYPNGLVYQPGNEKALYVAVKSIYKQLKEGQKGEELIAARTRILKLDDQFNEGLRSLAKGNVSEADAYFAEAVSCVKDEIRLYSFIGKALLEAKEVRRAFPYLRKGVELAPDDAVIKVLFDEATKQRDAL